MRNGSPSDEIARDREAIAARIELIESRLNKQHSAMPCGRRSEWPHISRLLGELIGLERGQPPVPVPSLRKLIGG